MSTNTKKRPLPPGWRWARLAEVCEFESGCFLPGTEIASSGPVPVYGANGLLGYTNKACFREPRIVLGRVGSVGAVNVTAGPTWITDNTIICRPREPADFDYVAAFLSSVDFDPLRAASVQPLITQKTLKALEMPLPPLDEQRRIAAHLAEQMAEVDKMRQAAEAQLEAVRALPDTLLEEVFGGFEPPS